MSGEEKGGSPGLLVTFVLVSTGLFMVTLDNLVVSTALPVIRVDLGASLQQLEWTVNAYTLTFAVFLLTGAALGDRFGRRRMFSLGVLIFTVASAGAALAPDAGALVAARAVQGLGAALVTPLSLTLLSEAVPDGKRGLAIGAWSGVSGLGVAMGPVVGGAITEGISWQWIFWVNVPIGLVIAPLAARMLVESYGPDRGLDPLGLTLAIAALLPITFGVIRASELGWTSATVLASLAAGAVLLAAFLVVEARAREPMLPVRFFRSRAFSATNAASFAMFFGIFGSIFFLSQFFVTVQGLNPLQAGVRILPWTAMPIFVAPVAGLLSDRVGARPLMALGLALQAFAMFWVARIAAVDAAYIDFVPAFVAAGAGMSLVFAPSANAVLSSVRPKEAGKASGATNTIRELGGVFGVSVLATVFAGAGGYASPQDYVDALRAALPVGAAVLVAGALVALLIPRYTSPGQAGEGEEASGAGEEAAPVPVARWAASRESEL
ncbi:MAG: MFS transporter, partial [Solirubrobacterales bacterium]